MKCRYFEIQLFISSLVLVEGIEGKIGDRDLPGIGSSRYPENKITLIQRTWPQVQNVGKFDRMGLNCTGLLYACKKLTLQKL